MYDFVYKHKRWLQIALLCSSSRLSRCSASISISAIPIPGLARQSWRRAHLRSEYSQALRQAQEKHARDDG
jgi:hypothetical protein